MPGKICPHIFCTQKLSGSKKIIQWYILLHREMSIKLSDSIEVNLAGLTEEEAKKVESVLRRAERIHGNGVIFQRVNSNVLSCSQSLLPKPGMFSDLSDQKIQWKPVEKPIMEIQVLRTYFFAGKSVQGVWLYGITKNRV